MKQCIKNERQSFTYFFQKIKKDDVLSNSFKKFWDVFFKKEISLISNNFLIEHLIELHSDKHSLFRLLYNLSKKELQVLKKYIDVKFSKNWIKLSTNFFKASVFFESKSNDFLRFCVDYRELNKIIYQIVILFFTSTNYSTNSSKAEYFSKLISETLIIVFSYDLKFIIISHERNHRILTNLLVNN